LGRDPSVVSVASDELIVGADLGKATVFDHDDLVAVANGPDATATRSS